MDTLSQGRTLIRGFALLRRAFGEYRLHLVVITVCAIVGGIFEAVGISAIIPIFSFFGGGGGEATDYITNAIQWLFSIFGIPYKFRYLLAFVAALFLMRVAASFIIQQITIRVVAGYERDIRRRLFGGLVHSEWQYFSHLKVGALNTVLLQHTTHAAQFFNYVSLLAVIGMKTVAYTIVALNVSFMLAVFALLAGLVQFVLLRPAYERGRRFSALSEKNTQALSQFVQEHLGGLKTVKALGKSDAVVARSDGLFETAREAIIGVYTLRGVTSAVTSLVALGFIGVAFAYYYSSPGFNIAAFLVAIFAVNQIFTQLQLAQTQMQTLINLTPFLSSLFKEVAEAEREREENTGGTEIQETSGDFVFSDVSFWHEHAGRRTLEHVSFRVPFGGLVGIVGPSGAGKTTIADLMLRLYEPTEGQINFGSVPIHEYDVSAWRNFVAYVPQDPLLLHDTVLNNIAFYSNASREDVVEGARRAHIHDVIEALPNGYDTVLGERGSLISGGQRQRIVLARCLVRKPKLFILDEATSALDAESELEIRKAIDELRGDATIIVIAHRFSTLAHADHIIALEKGHVVEEGTPHELLKNKESYYARMSRE